MSRATAPLLSRLGYQYCSAQMLRRPLVGAQAFRSPLASSILVRGMAMASHRMPLHKPAPVRDEFLRSLTTEELENMDIGIKEHRKPEDLSDKIAFRTVKALRVIADAFFREKYVHRAVTLETVAAVPGMVAGLHRHLRSLRRMDHDGGWINHLLAEAENERMHLLTWMKVSQPTLLERAIVLAVQGSFFNFYFLLYLFAPKTAHRVVGYLEEEAIISYTQMIAEIDAGRIPNGPAPTIAINYWNLPETARIREVTLAVRADEAMHRDTNHEFADRIKAHRENLRQEALNNQEQTNSGSKSTNS